jgi:hypothetical protein
VLKQKVEVMWKSCRRMRISPKLGSDVTGSIDVPAAYRGVEIRMFYPHLKSYKTRAESLHDRMVPEALP